jgi:hypothetical protein
MGGDPEGRSGLGRQGTGNYHITINEQWFWGFSGGSVCCLTGNVLLKSVEVGLQSRFKTLACLKGNFLGCLSGRFSVTVDGISGGFLN